jgi:phage shock protein PspC (stress-responsive transcriptional regulator)
VAVLPGTMEATLMDESTRPCPYCAEEISPSAVRCPHCRSRIALRDPMRWHRAHPGRKLAGVCVALAQALDLPVTPVRLAFLVGTLLHLAGAVAYVALWLIIPREPGHEPILVRAAAGVAETARRLFGNRPNGGSGSAPAGPVP